MKQDFVVHGVSMSTVPFRVEHQGKVINAIVNCLEVELNDPNGRHGSPTLRFIGDDVNTAESMFKNGAKVTATFEVESNTTEQSS